ncbi:MAG: hypothetical protein R3B92_00380 [Patescibacteria group bacterium]|uniref:Uncharacterized protein n=1 Tax=candidate division WWE3 bacterium TaxID=2053526 RepID=A0A955EBD8_UNCKA|nr:hypothetical protein [candidate division WWE3 bacterium]
MSFSLELKKFFGLVEESEESYVPLVEVASAPLPKAEVTVDPKVVTSGVGIFGSGGQDPVKDVKDVVQNAVTTSSTNPEAATASPQATNSTNTSMPGQRIAPTQIEQKDSIARVSL